MAGSFDGGQKFNSTFWSNDCRTPVVSSSNGTENQHSRPDGPGLLQREVWGNAALTTSRALESQNS